MRHNTIQGIVMISLTQLYIVWSINSRLSLPKGKAIFLRTQTDGITVLTNGNYCLLGTTESNCLLEPLIAFKSLTKSLKV